MVSFETYRQRMESVMDELDVHDYHRHALVARYALERACASEPGSHELFEALLANEEAHHIVLAAAAQIAARREGD